MPDRRRSKTETFRCAQVGEVEDVWFVRRAHHQAADRRRRPRQGHGAAFDWLRTAGKRSVEEQPAGVHLSPAGGLQKERLRGDEGLLVHSFHTGRSEEERKQAVRGARLLLEPV